ncbi:MAG: hypothetical protein J5563_01905 [Clostridia bacterium]|nr:hypothetical protein [Clostridia bacterium]
MISLLCAVGMLLNVPLLIMYRSEKGMRIYAVCTSAPLLAAGIFDFVLYLNGLKPVPWLGAVIYGLLAAFAVSWICVIMEGRMLTGVIAGPTAGIICGIFVAFYVTVAVPRTLDGKDYVGVYSPLTDNIDTVLTCYEKKGALFTSRYPSLRLNYGNPGQPRPDFDLETCTVEYID